MATITFDTLKFANRLKDAGVPGKQAEAEAEALADALEVNLKELATKEDTAAKPIVFARKSASLERTMSVTYGNLRCG